jgi:hypothetical protein
VLLQVRNCSVLALDLMEASLASISECAAFIGHRTYAKVVAFKKYCSYHAQIQAYKEAGETSGGRSALRLNSSPSPAPARQTCTILKTFEDDCLVPVLGAYGTLAVKTNMDGACQAMFWGLKTRDLPEVRRFVMSWCTPAC